MELSGDGPLPVMHFGMNGMLMVSYRLAFFVHLSHRIHRDSGTAQRSRAGLVYAET